MKNTVRIGTITETKVILKLLELGYNIFTPYGDGSKVDLIAQTPSGELLRVQVKTSRIQVNREIFSAYSAARIRSGDTNRKVRYTKEDIDCYATIDNEGNVYLIPVEAIKAQHGILLYLKEFILRVS